MGLVSVSLRGGGFPTSGLSCWISIESGRGPRGLGRLSLILSALEEGEAQGATRRAVQIEVGGGLHSKDWGNQARRGELPKGRQKDADVCTWKARPICAHKSREGGS